MAMIRHTMERGERATPQRVVDAHATSWYGADYPAIFIISSSFAAWAALFFAAPLPSPWSSALDVSLTRGSGCEGRGISLCARLVSVFRCSHSLFRVSRVCLRATSSRIRASVDAGENPPRAARAGSSRARG